MADVPFSTYGVEVVNIRNPIYAGGAPTDGVTDAQPAFQAAVDAAFGTAAAPHGSNSWQNRPLYIPHGHYRVATPVNFTNVQGGYIFGDGTVVSAVNGDTTAFLTNGLSRCRFEKMSIALNFFSASNVPAVELDWNGSTAGAMAGADLTHNTFHEVNFSNATASGICVRVGLSGNGGTDNHFDSCYFSGGDTSSLISGLVVAALSARGNKVTECNLAQCTKGIYIINGSVTLISGGAFQSGGTVAGRYDIFIDDCADTVVVHGIRSESMNGIRHHGTKAVKVDGFTMSIASAVNFANLVNGTLILDACAGIGTITGTSGNLYIRGCNFIGGIGGFSGTVVQNI